MNTRQTEERVILVDGLDREIGSEEKLQAHRTGVLHRAFSVFVFDDDDRVLLQRRASGKYHSGGLWSNTCCGHPRPGEATAAAARRRLREEMGIDCPLEERFAFTYRAELPAGLVEHELDHVFTARFRGEVTPDPAEVEGWKWTSMAVLEAECAAQPHQFTAWLPIALEEMAGRLR